MWILDQWGDQLVHVGGDRGITIVDCFEIVVTGKNYNDVRGCCMLGCYRNVGRTKEVLNQVANWVAAGAPGVFRMPKK